MLVLVPESLPEKCAQRVPHTSKISSGPGSDIGAGERGQELRPERYELKGRLRAKGSNKKTKLYI